MCGLNNDLHEEKINHVFVFNHVILTMWSKVEKNITNWGHPDLNQRPSVC